MGELLLVVPSRMRPANMERLCQALQDTCRADTQLLVGLDEDDPQRSCYDFALWPKVQVEVRAGLHQVVPWLNTLAVPAAEEFSYLGHIGDDQGTPTVGWDVRVIEALERAPFAFVDDEYPTREKGTLCCHIFLQSKVVKKLDYFGPPALRHMFVDVAWMAWGKACGIEFLADVKWPHEHYSIGAAEVDASYQASFSWTNNDLAGFNEYAHTQLNADIEKLGGTPYTAETLAQFKRDLFVPCARCG